MNHVLASLLLSAVAATSIVGCGSSDPATTDAAVAVSEAGPAHDALGADGKASIAAEAGPADGIVDRNAADATSDVAITDGGLGVLPDLAPLDSSLDSGLAAPDANPIDALALPADGGCTGWTTLQRISPAAAVELMGAIDPIVINVHVPYEGDIPGTDTSIPYNDVDAIDAYLRHDHCAEILLVCKSGGMSKSAGDQLIKRGYLRVRDLAGGMMAWEAAGYPLLKDGGT